MAKRKSDSSPAGSAVPESEVDAAEMFAPSGAEETHLQVVYRGGHPLVRRCGVVLRPDVLQIVKRPIAELLATGGDVEIVWPSEAPENPTT